MTTAADRVGLRYYDRGQQVSEADFIGRVLSNPLALPFPHQLRLVPPLEVTVDRPSNRFEVRLNLFPLVDAREPRFRVELDRRASQVLERRGY